MADAALFPHFKPLGIEDRALIAGRLQAYEPETSELTFTNLFIWRRYYGLEWSLSGDMLLLACNPENKTPFCLPPIGPGPRRETVGELLSWLREARQAPDPFISRADGKLVRELSGNPEFSIEPEREHFDYRYRSADLIGLAGRKYHGKKNHLNKFRATCRFSYEPMTREHVPACLKFQDAWCNCNRCADDMNLMHEWAAVKELLGAFDRLGVQGGVILIDGIVEAFTLGELLNRETAVVHIEKANAQIPGLYSVINQQFCEHALSGVPFINREQDLGDEGLRQAKLSYQRERLVEKYVIRLAADLAK